MASIHLPYEQFKAKVAEQSLVIEHTESDGFYYLVAYAPRTEWQCRINKDCEDVVQYLLDLNA